MRRSHTIDYKDITFVVQGPVAGLPTDPYEKRHTYRCLKSIRSSFPGATIILSTWENANVADLDFDTVVTSPDPGLFPTADWTPNVVRQIISTRTGLAQCTTQYVVKTRPDLLFKNDAIIDYFETFNALPFDPAYKILKQRVVMLPTVNPRRRHTFPFSISDWILFGRTEDVRTIFDFPIERKQILKKDGQGVEREICTPYSSEQFIWFSFLSQHRKIPFAHITDTSGDNIVTAEKYLANNCILVPAGRAGIDWIRFKRAAYAQIPALSNTGLYTFTDYKRMLNAYADAQLTIIPNPIEELTYAIVYPLRHVIGKKSPKLWDFIRRTVNRKTHKDLDVFLGRTREKK